MGTTTTSAPAVEAVDATGLRAGGGFRRWVCCGSTTNGTGVEAFSALVPREWQTEGGLRRMSDLGADPFRSVARFLTTDPTGEASVELVGTTAVVPGHLDPASHVLAEVLPRARPDATQVRVLALRSPEHLPWPVPATRSRAAEVTVAYVANGTAWRERIVVAVGHPSAGPAEAGSELSVTVPGLATRAPAATADCWEPVLATIAASFVVNGAWLAGHRAR